MTDHEDKRKKLKLEYEQKLWERAEEASLVRKIVLVITLLVLIIGGGMLVGGFLYIRSALQPVDPESDEEIVVEIPMGSGVSKIASILEEHKVIKDDLVFKYYVRFKNETGFQAGTYQFTPSMTLDEIISILKTGKVHEDAALVITIPEGIWLKDIAKIIADHLEIPQDEVFQTLNDPDFIAEMMEMFPDLLTEEILQENIKYPLEGYLFPATYSYTEEKPSIKEIVIPMLEKTQEVIGKYRSDLNAREMTVHELLTLASLIEEEAVTEEDRRIISSVFYNRMEIGMPLQTDPTVIYAMGEHRERLYYKDYEIDDPYNTYKISNLPPGPIANPGEISIEAALYPASTDYLFFLATREGEVLFSETLEEHNQKIKEHISQQ